MFISSSTKKSKRIRPSFVTPLRSCFLLSSSIFVFDCGAGSFCCTDGKYSSGFISCKKPIPPAAAAPAVFYIEKECLQLVRSSGVRGTGQESRGLALFGCATLRCASGLPSQLLSFSFISLYVRWRSHTLRCPKGRRFRVRSTASALCGCWPNSAKPFLGIFSMVGFLP